MPAPALTRVPSVEAPGSPILPTSDQSAAVEAVAAALACGLTRDRLSATIAELRDATVAVPPGAALAPRLDLALLHALRTLEALLSAPVRAGG